MFRSWFERWLRRMLSRLLRRPFRPSGRDEDLDAEIRFYLDEETRLRVERGESPEAARQATRRDFGNVTLVTEATRRVWGWTLAEDFVRDLRHGLRLLARSPLFAAVAVLSLALGVGANTAIFSLADAVIFRELPVREPGRLLQLQGIDARGRRHLVHSVPFAQEMQSRTQAFSAIAAAGAFASLEPVAIERAADEAAAAAPGIETAVGQAAIASGTETAAVQAASPPRVSPAPAPLSGSVSASALEIRARLTIVTGNYFDALGVGPSIGRTFTVDDDRAPGGHPVAVVSHRFWTSILGGGQDVLRTRVRHNGISYQVLGVAPAGFTGISSNDDPDIWLPMSMADIVLARPVIRNPQTASLYVFGRLKDGVSAADGSADVARVYRDLQGEGGAARSDAGSSAAGRSDAGSSAAGRNAAGPSDAGRGAAGRSDARRSDVGRSVDGQRGDAVSMARGVQALRERFERPLLVLLAIVGLLLLIACANLAALLLARAASRRHEIAVRLALGASRARLARQFLTESLVVGLLGGAAGLAVSAWGAAALTGMVTSSTRRLPIYFAADARILIFTAAVSLLAVVIFGLLPAWQANRTPFAQISASTGARTHTRLPAGRLLIAGQMALSVFLLIAAGLFIRSLANLRDQDTGFSRAHVLVLQLDARPAFGQDLRRYVAMFRALPEPVRALPGVRSAAMTSGTFFGGSLSRGNIAYEGHAGEAPEDERPIKVRVTPQFAETVGLTLIAGRLLTDRDDERAAPVAVVSESIARRYFPGMNPVGRRFTFGSAFSAESATTIVGVVRDVRYASLRDASPHTLYLPLAQQPTPRGDLLVRTWGDPAAITSQVERVVRRYDPGVRVVHAVTLDRLVEDSIIQDRLLASLASAFGLLALLLSAVGLYGITAYGVHRRVAEIGLRLALGASARDVQWLVLREILTPVLIGAAIGVPAALAASSLVRALLFGVQPTDPLIVVFATMALVLTAMIAGYLPARRACRVDPIQALRHD